MNSLSVSVIVVSRGRPNSLKCCLLGISQLYYEPFEVIVVADQAGLDAIAETKFYDSIKVAQCEQPNISIARNLGLALASGDVVAFIDDDAVPEPGWLFHLIGPFSDPDVASAGGFVRGSNGISFEARASKIDRFGASHVLEMTSNAPETLDPNPDSAVSTIGTNCAFRLENIREIGGFDSSFEYFLEESDINLRLAKAGKRAAIVPLAEVHHQMAASERRSHSKMPRSLFQHGVSTVVFLRKHAGSTNLERHIEKAAAKFRRSALRHLVRGNCEPSDVELLMHSFHAGAERGRRMEIEKQSPLVNTENTFKPFFARQTGPPIVVSGYYYNVRKLHREAARLSRSGQRVSLFVFSRTALFHRVRFCEHGYWCQHGGLFGKAVRAERIFVSASLPNRVAREFQRVAAQRYPWHLLETKDDGTNKRV